MHLEECPIVAVSTETDFREVAPKNRNLGVEYITVSFGIAALTVVCILEGRDKYNKILGNHKKAMAAKAEKLRGRGLSDKEVEQQLRPLGDEAAQQALRALDEDD